MHRIAKAMSISALRSAITTAGGTPTQWTHVGLLRELITSWRGTPTRWSIAGLLKEAIIAAGGVVTQVEQMTLLRELITTLGTSPSGFNADTLWAQLATLANIPVSGAPVATAQPVVSGTLRTGSVLSTTNGTWTNVPTGYAYQWFRGITAIGTNASTYTLVSADEGANITCRVAATNATGTGFSTSAAVGPILPLAPTNSVAPAVTGTATQGQTLSVSSGTWANSPTGYAYQWKRDGVSLGSTATANTYVLVAGDVGTNITCDVTASNAGGSATATSNTVGPISASGGLSAPVLTKTSASTVNPMEWDSDFTSYITWDSATSTGDKHLMRWRRVNGGAWTTEVEQPLDDELLTGGFTWPLWEAAKPLAGGYVEVQEQRVRYSAGVETLRSAWSNALTDTLAAQPFSPADLFGGSDFGYAWNPTDLTKVFQNNNGTGTGAFGSRAGRLVDISGKNNHLNGFDDTSDPVLQNVSNGLVQFDGSNDKLLAVSGLYAKGAATFMLAVKIPATSAVFLWSESSSSSSAPLYAPGTRQLGTAGEDCYVHIRNDANSNVVAAAIDSNGFDNTIHILTLIDTGSQVTAYIDGVSKGSQSYTRSALTPNQGHFGCQHGGQSGGNGSGSDFMTGSIGSGCFIGRVLTGGHTTANSELNKLYNWIAGKHGLATL